MYPSLFRISSVFIIVFDDGAIATSDFPLASAALIADNPLANVACSILFSSSLFVCRYSFMNEERFAIDYEQFMIFCFHFNFLNPKSFATSLKHLPQMLRLYFDMNLRVPPQRLQSLRRLPNFLCFGTLCLRNLASLVLLTLILS